MADIEDSTTSAEVHDDSAEEQENENTLLEENDNKEEDIKAQITGELNEEADESALLDHEEAMEQQNEAQGKGDRAEDAADNDDADERAAAEDNIVITEEERKAEEAEEDEDEAEAKPKDANEMPQVNVANLAKRKWQVKVYPLKPEDFSNGQISRVFSNARESLLYILSSGRTTGGKGEMYISSAIQASRVVHNLMKLDFKSSHINIEIIRKNDEGAIEEKAFMRFDAKLVRMLCVPLLPTRRMGSKRERIIGSVFVKNLPKGTSKDMLRVMFPFAPEINYNPEKFHDGTARLVLSTRNAVIPCLRAFAKVELGEVKLELRPLQKKTKSTDDVKTSSSRSHEKSESDSTSKSKTESKEEESKKSESDTKKDDKESPTKASGEKGDSSTREQSKASSKKSPSASKSSDPKKEKSKEKDQSTKTDTGRAHSESGDSRNRRNRAGRDQRRWRNPRDSRGDGGLRNMRNRARIGSSFGQRLGDRNRFRSNSGFGNRNRPDERRMRAGLAGTSGAGEVGTEATKEMILLQSQLSMAIKNQLSMLNQTQFALEQAKRGAGVGLSLARDVAPAAPTSLLSKHLPEPYGLSQLSSEHARRGQVRRRQQTRRGRSRDKRVDGEQLASLVGDYGYKRNANMANLALDYGASGYGKRRNAGLAGHGDGPSWSDDRNASAFGHSQAQYAYEQEVDAREAEYQSLQAGSLNPNSLYSHAGYGYRY